MIKMFLFCFNEFTFKTNAFLKWDLARIQYKDYFWFPKEFFS